MSDHQGVEGEGVGEVMDRLVLWQVVLEIWNVAGAAPLNQTTSVLLILPEGFARPAQHSAAPPTMEMPVMLPASMPQEENDVLALSDAKAEERDLDGGKMASPTPSVTTGSNSASSSSSSSSSSSLVSERSVHDEVRELRKETARMVAVTSALLNPPSPPPSPGVIESTTGGVREHAHAQVGLLGRLTAVEMGLAKVAALMAEVSRS